MAVSSQLVIGCWVVFLLFWIVGAFFVKSTVERTASGTAIVLRISLVIGIVLLLTRHRLAVNLAVPPRTPLLSIVGNTLCLAGLLLSLWARITLGRNWSASVTFKRDHELIRTGPYAVIRHPIYTAVILMIIGTVVFVGRIEGLVIVALAIVGFSLKLRAEERLLTTHFPTDYPAYKARTKALVPFVF